MHTQSITISIYHLPHQKGHLKDYWIAICESNFQWGESKQKALYKMLRCLNENLTVDDLQ